VGRLRVEQRRIANVALCRKALDVDGQCMAILGLKVRNRKVDTEIDAKIEQGGRGHSAITSTTPGTLFRPLVLLRLLLRRD
jgi:hypothetical protein